MKNISRITAITLAVAAGTVSLACNGCSSAGPQDSSPASTPSKLSLSSSSFEPGASIPVVYTCKGKDISPPLQWSEPPQGTKSLALIMDDPDAAGWTHWVVFNLPADVRGLEEAIAKKIEQFAGAQNGSNSWNRQGYGGPCPPFGEHRYVFRIYALDKLLSAPSGASKKDVLGLMSGHILATGELMGKFAKK